MAKRHFSKDPRLIDMAGQRVGHWFVLCRDSSRNNGVWWYCRCDCGNHSTVSGVNLRGGKSQSCGCARATQGWLSTTREYAIWAKMMRRCHNPWSANFRFYGGKGIFVCRRWRDSFQAFLEDTGQAPSPTHSLDRINTFGSYTCGKCDECRSNNAPANCRWATKAEQARNQKSNRWYTHDGKTLILKDWARLTNIPYITLWNRLNTGMPFAQAISVKQYDRKAIKSAKASSREEQSDHRE